MTELSAGYPLLLRVRPCNILSKYHSFVCSTCVLTVVAFGPLLEHLVSVFALVAAAAVAVWC